MKWYHIFLFCVEIPAILFLIRGQIRLNKVTKLRLKILHLESDYYDKHLDEWVRGGRVFPVTENLPSWGKMTYSFKPLTLEKWLSKKDLKRLCGETLFTETVLQKFEN